MYTCYIQSFKILASCCSWADWFESYLVENPWRHIFAWCGSDKHEQTVLTWVRQSDQGLHCLPFIIIEPAHEILVLFLLHKLLLQMHMRSHPEGLDVWILVWPFTYFHTSCVRTAKALVRLGSCTGSPEPSLVAYVISTIISWAGLYIFWLHSCILKPPCSNFSIITTMLSGVPVPGGGGGAPHIWKWYICAVEDLKIGGLWSGPSLKMGGGLLSEWPLIEKTGNFGTKNNNKEMYI